MGIILDALTVLILRHSVPAWAMAVAMCAFSTNAAPNFDLVGFASLNALGQNGTSGGADGAHVQVSTLADFVRYLETNVALRVEILNDIDCSPLANNSGGFPSSYPVGEILVNSNKTIYSKNGATIRRGMLRIGKGPNGKHNIIIRNLKFRDLWVLDPTGQYDQYGWDYIGIEAGSHHIWVDHCEFEQVYDGMVDVKGASDFVTVSWNIFRAQKKCNLVGASETATSDRGHLNVTFHHNWYDRVEERIPRMRFGNAHVFNLYCDQLGGKGIQSTTEAATLVENVYFYHPRSGSSPTIEVNGGGTGTVKVVNSIIVNAPGGNVSFRQYGAATFTFNPPFASPTPPYSYTLDPVADVPNIVTNYAGTGKIGFELWQMEQFTPAQLADANVSGRDSDPDGDGMRNYDEFVAGTNPTSAGSAVRFVAASRIGNDLKLTWRTAGSRTNIMEAASHLSPSDFEDISGPIPISTPGDTLTNFVHSGAFTNSAQRFYRIRVYP
jgi:pectate lyase